MRAGAGPGPASVEGLRWLCRVGPASIEAWRCAMGWAAGTARSHVARLTHEGWLDRVARPLGEGSLYFPTRAGVVIAGVDVPLGPVPAPTWWRHLEACAWVAAWLTARDREMLGPRELLVRRAWRGELLGLGGPRELVHRPDLIGVVPGRRPAAIEVELTRKSKLRLRAILRLHARWIAAGQSGACLYVCGDPEIRDLVSTQATASGLDVESGSLRLELLDTIRDLAVRASQTVPRGTRAIGVGR
jgi:hypothetical protein